MHSKSESQEPLAQLTED